MGRGNIHGWVNQFFFKLSFRLGSGSFTGGGEGDWLGLLACVCVCVCVCVYVFCVNS